MSKYINLYVCPCGNRWSDRSDHVNNDRCPACDLEVEPACTEDTDDFEDLGKPKNEGGISLPFETREFTITREAVAFIAVELAVTHSAWFMCTPLPDDEFRFHVKTDRWPDIHAAYHRIFKS